MAYVSIDSTRWESEEYTKELTSNDLAKDAILNESEYRILVS